MPKLRLPISFGAAALAAAFALLLPHAAQAQDNSWIPPAGGPQHKSAYTTMGWIAPKPRAAC